jgi:hypothetical protein
MKSWIILRPTNYLQTGNTKNKYPVATGGMRLVFLCVKKLLKKQKPFHYKRVFRLKKIISHG